MVEGYNFDGDPERQAGGHAPRRRRHLPLTTVYSVPNFYGAHGHDSDLPSMSAILYAAGPSLKQGKKLEVVHNIDIVPTVMRILGVAPAPTVDGEVIPKILRP